jgi:hypothetical protein
MCQGYMKIKALENDRFVEVTFDSLILKYSLGIVE